jgi:hypothetical protein
MKSADCELRPSDDGRRPLHRAGPRRSVRARRSPRDRTHGTDPPPARPLLGIRQHELHPSGRDRASGRISGVAGSNPVVRYGAGGDAPRRPARAAGLP